MYSSCLPIYLWVRKLTLLQAIHTELIDGILPAFILGLPYRNHSGTIARSIHLKIQKIRKTKRTYIYNPQRWGGGQNLVDLFTDWVFGCSIVLFRLNSAELELCLDRALQKNDQTIILPSVCTVADQMLSSFASCLCCNSSPEQPGRHG